MAHTKLFDLSVKTGSYQKNGETKARWGTIGSLWADDKGGQYIRLNRTFNPAGITPKSPEDDTIFVSCFEPKERDEAPRRSNADELAF